MLILTANQVALAAGEREHFNALRAQMLRDIQPVNGLQIECFNQALRSAWDVRRCDAAERHLATESGVDPLLLKDTRVDRIHRHRRQAERSFRQAIAELKKLQTDRAMRQLKENKGLDALPVPIDTKAYIAAAREASCLKKGQRITFPPVQATLDRFVRERNLGENSWDAWMRRQSANTPAKAPVLSAKRSTGVPKASSIET